MLNRTGSGAGLPYRGYAAILNTKSGVQAAKTLPALLRTGSNRILESPELEVEVPIPIQDKGQRSIACCTGITAMSLAFRAIDRATLRVVPGTLLTVGRTGPADRCGTARC